MKQTTRKANIGLALLLMLTVLLAPANAYAEQPDFEWVEGSGQTVQLGDKATIVVPEGYVFLDGPNTIAYEEYYGMIPSDKEIGAVIPNSEDEDWIVYFEYEDSGHIEDADQQEIDADALLESYTEGQKEANKEMDESNWLFVDGWDVEPFYDTELHSLKWSLLLHDNSNNKLVNYNMRLLTREGYISAILVSSPETLEKDRQTFERDILASYSVNEGHRYSDYNPETDKKADYGLAGLILGGAGLAVAKKAGLLAVILVFVKKFWFIGIAVIAGLFKLFKRKKKDEPTSTNGDMTVQPSEDTNRNNHLS
ncbi:DUF2167 domain-containing protein [Paenibacillus tarimensis]|uniref:DUF2167 domain-containing protein n=1 Tax=Paenibacillus tarimensis TaxID=416012 RepID=UPI001F182282|nr:DUF2167 domain-containing protein [Paenibacillus tarimensis]MCF2944618.1 DUF2167 domain-containing protein [Paenibacillus tarimensis]